MAYPISYTTVISQAINDFDSIWNVLKAKGLTDSSGNVLSNTSVIKTSEYNTYISNQLVRIGTRNNLSSVSSITDYGNSSINETASASTLSGSTLSIPVSSSGYIEGTTITATVPTQSLTGQTITAQTWSYTPAAGKLLSSISGTVRSGVIAVASPTITSSDNSTSPTSSGSEAIHSTGAPATNVKITIGASDSATISTAGWLASGTTNGTSSSKIVYIPAVIGSTITPKSSSTTISKDHYILGSDIVVQGDSNLVPSNIKSGISIFGITGTYSDFDTSAVSTGSEIRYSTTPNANGYYPSLSMLVGAIAFSEGKTIIGSMNDFSVATTATNTYGAAGSGTVISGAYSSYSTSTSKLSASISSTGYVESGKTTIDITGLPTSGAATYTPSASVQTASVSGKFMTGDITINKIPTTTLTEQTITAQTWSITGSSSTAYTTISGTVQAGSAISSMEITPNLSRSTSNTSGNLGSAINYNSYNAETGTYAHAAISNYVTIAGTSSTSFTKAGWMSNLASSADTAYIPAFIPDSSYTPTSSSQTISTIDKYLTENIVINKIPTLGKSLGTITSQSFNITNSDLDHAFTSIAGTVQSASTTPTTTITQVTSRTSSATSGDMGTAINYNDYKAETGTYAHSALADYVTIDANSLVNVVTPGWVASNITSTDKAYIPAMFYTPSNITGGGTLTISTKDKYLTNDISITTATGSVSAISSITPVASRSSSALSGDIGNAVNYNSADDAGSTYVKISSTNSSTVSNGYITSSNVSTTGDTNYIAAIIPADSYTPTSSTQTLTSAEKYVTKNIVINPIPVLTEKSLGTIVSKDFSITNSDLDHTFTAISGTVTAGALTAGTTTLTSTNNTTSPTASGAEAIHSTTAQTTNVKLTVSGTGKVSVGTSGWLASGTSASSNSNSVITYIPAYISLGNYIPGTSDTTISKDQYILGSNIVLKGDSNLIASNIKYGVSIFGVTGSYTNTDTSGTQSGTELRYSTVNSVNVSYDVLNGAAVYSEGQLIYGRMNDFSLATTSTNKYGGAGAGTTIETTSATLSGTTLTGTLASTGYILSGTTKITAAVPTTTMTGQSINSQSWTITPTANYLVTSIGGTVRSGVATNSSTIVEISSRSTSNTSGNMGTAINYGTASAAGINYVTIGANASTNVTTAGWISSIPTQSDTNYIPAFIPSSSYTITSTAGLSLTTIDKYLTGNILVGVQSGAYSASNSESITSTGTIYTSAPTNSISITASGSATATIGTAGWLDTGSKTSTSSKIVYMETYPTSSVTFSMSSIVSNSSSSQTILTAGKYVPNNITVTAEHLYYDANDKAVKFVFA